VLDSPKKIALFIFFASVLVNAALGILALFAGEFGETQFKVLMTSLSISAASVGSLAMLPARERGLLGNVPNAGIVLIITLFALLIILVWTDLSSGNFARIVGTVFTFALATAYSSLIVLAAVAERYKWVMRAAFSLVTVLSVMIVVILWTVPSGDADWIGRIIGLISILLAALTVSIPVLHRISRDELKGSEENKRLIEASHCANCGSNDITRQLDLLWECAGCGVMFTADVYLPTVEEELLNPAS
jgi:hypothetical protein